MGDNGGQFFGLELAATDSRDNIYTGEEFSGERVQRLVPAGSPRGKLLKNSATGLCGSIERHHEVVQRQKRHHVPQC